MPLASFETLQVCWTTGKTLYPTVALLAGLRFQVLDCSLIFISLLSVKRSFFGKNLLPAMANLCVKYQPEPILLESLPYP